MTSETDQQFMDRVDLDLDLNNTADIQRLFALARRGAAAKADDRRKGVGCYASCEWTRDQHDIRCPHFDPSILPPPPAGETSDE